MSKPKKTFKRYTSDDSSQGCGKKGKKRHLEVPDDGYMREKIKSQRKAPKMSQASSRTSSSLSSSLSAKSSLSKVDSMSYQKADSTGQKAQCDLCKLSYTSQKELTEHLVSLMHHTKMDDREENPEHRCGLCNVTCSNMSEYRSHITGERHQEKLTQLRGNSEEKNSKDRKQTFNGGGRSHHPAGNHKPLLGSGPPRNHWSKHRGGFNSQSYYNDGQRSRPEWGVNHGSARGNAFNNSGVQRGINRSRRQCEDDSWNNNTQRHRNDIQQHGRGNTQHQWESLSYEPWGSGCYGDWRGDDTYNTNFSSHGRLQHRARRTEGEEAYRQQERNTESGGWTGNFGGNDFSSHGHWDERSLAMQEEFLAGMAESPDVPNFFSEDTPSSSFYTDFQEQVPSREIQFEKEYHIRAPDHHKQTKNGDPYPNDRKRPRNTEGNQERSIAKSSRSFDHGSKEHYQNVQNADSFVRPVPTSAVQKSYDLTATKKRPTQPDLSDRMASMNNASDNILARAERLCKELHEKRKASQRQRDLNLTKYNEEHSSETANTLLQKQQHFTKDSRPVSGSKDFHPGTSSSRSSRADVVLGVSGAAQFSEKCSKEPTSRVQREKLVTNSLEDIRKSMEKSVLGDSAQSKNKTKSSVQSVTRTRKSSSESNGLGRVNETLNNIEVSSKQASRPNPVVLTKDSIKSMVNSPQSRAGRVQMAKILQSREESRPGLRTNIQLDGLYSSVDNLSDLGESTEPAPIKLEDLSVGIQQQILALINKDMGGQCHTNSASKAKQKTNKPDPPAPSEILLLSDDDAENTGTSSISRHSSKSDVSKNKGSTSKTKKKKGSTATPAVTPASSLARADKNRVGSSKKSFAIACDKPGNKRHPAHVNRESPTYAAAKSAYAKTNLPSKHMRATSSFVNIDSSDSETPQFDTTRQVPSEEFLTSPPEDTEHHAAPDISSNVNTQDDTERAGSKSLELSSHSILQRTSDDIRKKFPMIMNIPQHKSTSQLKNLSTNAADVTRVSASLPVASTSSRQTSTIQQSGTIETSLGLSPFADTVSAPTSAHGDSSTSPSHTPLTCEKEATLPAADVTSDFAMPELRDSGSENIEDYRLNLIESSPVVPETPTDAMTELLLLSQREEKRRQEMRGMELRLSRLHRLLEQAVVQINKCTERRSQLQEEEQNLAERRLHLVRDAVRSSHIGRSQLSDPKDTSSVSEPVRSGMAARVEGPGSCVSNTGNTATTNTPAATLSRIMSDNKGASTLESSDLATGSESMTLTKSVSNSSLTKADWLAKFSSYLPKDVTDSSKSSINVDSGINILSNETSPSSRSLSTETDQSVHQLKSTDSVDRLSSWSRSCTDVTLPDQTPACTPDNVNTTTVTSTSPVETTSNPFTAPVMYVGSFRGSNRITLSSVTSVMKDSGSMDQRPEFIRSVSQTSSTGNNSAGEEHFSGAQKALGKVLNIGHRGEDSPRAGEDSDMGSLASSVASGSSLGEKIVHYCRSSSLNAEEARNKHNLSVIMSAPSDTSDMRGYDSQIELLEEEQHGGGYVRMDDSDQYGDKSGGTLDQRVSKASSGIYGNLDKDAVMSAEALHLLERNHEGSTCPSSLPSDGKKKKMKTKQERNDMGLRVHRRRRLIVLSSSEEENEKNSVPPAQDSCAIISCVRRNDSVNSSLDDIDKDDTDGAERVGGNRTPKRSDLVNQAQRMARETDAMGQTLDNSRVTVTECDSSTAPGMADSRSVNMLSNNQKDARDSFIKTFGRRPRSSSGDINSTSRDSVILNKKFSGEEKNTKRGNASDGSNHIIVLDEEVSEITVNRIPNDLLNVEDDILSSNLTAKSKKATGVCSQLVKPDPTDEDLQNLFPPILFRDSLLKAEDDEKSRDSKMPGNFGLIMELQVLDRYLYVAYRNYGVRVYNIEGAQVSFVIEYPIAGVQCMCLSQNKENQLTLIAGLTDSLLFHTPSEAQDISFALDGVVKCLLLVNPLLYAGLETGEISIFDSKEMTEKDRFICADQPVHCIAQAREGFSQLLCAATQGGAIIIVDAAKHVPLRILVGHSKTVFSLQVHGHTIFSASGDGSVLAQNLHTSILEHVYSEKQGMVNCVCYSGGYLFTGGMDKFVRCYDVETHNLVQVFYGADKGVITKILIYKNMLVTGTLSGSVDMVKLDLPAENWCRQPGCNLNFGCGKHLLWHLFDDHGISGLQLILQALPFNHRGDVLLDDVAICHGCDFTPSTFGHVCLQV